MSAIDFVVRSSTGEIRQGEVAGDGAPSTMIAGVDQDISLNLYQAQVVGYLREGQALQITLMDGRVVTIEGFFTPEGVPLNQLYLSADGQLTEVNLADGAGGTVYASYVDLGSMEKWSPDGDIYIDRSADMQLAADAGVVPNDDDVGMLGAGLLGGLGGGGFGLLGPLLGGVAVVGGLGGGGGGDGDAPLPPTVAILDGTGGTGTVVNEVDYTDGVEINGTGTPGATVTVTINDVIHEVVVTDDGLWDVVFTPDEVDPGEYTVPVTVTIEDENGSATVTDTVVLDTMANVTFDADHVETDGTINLVEESDGFVLNGTTQVGSTVVVTIDGVDRTATVTGTDWTLTVPAGVIEQGEYDLSVTVTATDIHNNMATVTDTVHVDTVTGITMNTGAIGGDGTVNRTEHADGTIVTGTAEAGASVAVTIGTRTVTVTATATGTWSATFAAADVAAGTYEATVTAVATDRAGNTASTSGTFHVDTDLNLTVNTAAVETDGIVNAVEASDGVTLTGTAEPGATVTVVMNGFTHTAVATAAGDWSVTYAASEIPSGTLGAPVAVSAVDTAGNTENISATLPIDTEASVDINRPIEGDNIINAAEAADGVVITGTSEAGSTSVVVTMGTTTLAATVAANGTWTVNFPASSVAPGEYETTISAVASDHAGNTATNTATVLVDTITSVTLNASIIETDGVINGVERADGVAVTGSAQAGATVVVTMAGVALTTTATAAGTWSVNYAAAQVPVGETTASITAVATDPAGNTATTNGTVQIDTFVNNLAVTTHPGGDNVVNFAENGQPISVAGTVEAGSTVGINMGGTVVSATVAANGNWTAMFPAGSLPPGEYTTQMVVSATDRAGNTTSMTESVLVDTVAGDLTLSPMPIETDDIINKVEASDGVVIHGTATPGFVVTVTLSGVTHYATAGANGLWTTTYLNGEITAGTYEAPITAMITDPVGNTRLVTDTVRVDTLVENFHFATAPIEGDGIINAAEAADGVTINGTVEPLSSVVIRFGSATQTVSAGANGLWTANFVASAIPSGESNVAITATATDLAGNVETIITTVQVDTIVSPLTMTKPVEGDNIVNIAEASDGVTLNGTVERGSSVNVTVNGITHAALVSATGQWSAYFAPTELPTGEATAHVTIAATDAVGNTASMTESFLMDTIAPDAPEVVSVDMIQNGLRSVGVAGEGLDLDVYAVSSTGAVTNVGFREAPDAFDPEIDLRFNTPIPDGSQLVITSTDDAGNQSGTLFVLDTASPGSNLVEVTDYRTAGFGVNNIDLRFAEDADLVLTRADLENLSGTTDSVTILGGGDDEVTILGAVDTGTTTMVNGDTFHVFTLGDADNTLMIQHGVNVVI